MLDFTQPATTDASPVIQMLRERDVTPTRQRVQVARIVFARPQHLSAEQILMQLRNSGAAISKATVYNTLNMFVQQGLIREVHVDPERTYYDSNVRPHHHFYNVDTGILTDIAPEAVIVSELPNLPAGTVADGVEVVIRIRNAI